MDAARSKRRSNHLSRSRTVSRMGDADIQNETFDDGGSADALPQLMSVASDDEVPFSH